MGQPSLLSGMEGKMGSALIKNLSDNIISPLGFTTAENLESVLSGETRLMRYHGKFGLPEDFCGSFLDRASIESRFNDLGKEDKGYTFFEKMCLLSISSALKGTGIDPSAEDVVFVLSSTKGNVEYLEESLYDERCYIAGSATKIASFFGNSNIPVVASNACISGVCAQISAIRQLLSGRYRMAIVTGADTLSEFIISGFQSFKALSPDPCRPYDSQRRGLNLGEAVGTMILSVDSSPYDSWRFRACSIHNDANHISGPSRTGEGSYRVLTDILREVPREELAFVSAHGTATAYNDEMESIAIHRAGLDEVPVTGLKGFYGHTLGAAGMIETILAMAAVDNNTILPTKGYESQGTSCRLNLSDRRRESDKKSFIKILSGFGGSNAGIAYTKGGES